MRIGPRVSVAAWWPVLGDHHLLVLGFSDTPVCHQAAGIQLNLDLVLGLAHLHAAADPIHWGRIAVAVQRDVSLDIHQSLMQPVNFWNPRWQRLQMQPLDCEQLTWNRANMFLVSRVDLIAPLPCPLIQIPQLLKVRPARKFPSIKLNGLSTRAERFAFPIACATN